MSIAGIWAIVSTTVIFGTGVFVILRMYRKDSQSRSNAISSGRALAQQAGWRFYDGLPSVPNLGRSHTIGVQDRPAIVPGAGWFPMSFLFALEFGHHGCHVVAHYAEWKTVTSGMNSTTRTTLHRRFMVQTPIPPTPYVEIVPIGPFPADYARSLSRGNENPPRCFIMDDGVDGHYRINSGAPAFVRALFTPDVCQWLVSHYPGLTGVSFANGVVNVAAEERTMTGDEIMRHAETITGLVTRIPPQAWKIASQLTTGGHPGPRREGAS